jgi:hypothetical protein
VVGLPEGPQHRYELQGRRGVGTGTAKRESRRSSHSTAITIVP